MEEFESLFAHSNDSPKKSKNNYAPDLDVLSESCGGEDNMSDFEDTFNARFVKLLRRVKPSELKKVIQ